jgi:hypothetical protein
MKPPPPLSCGLVLATFAMGAGAMASVLAGLGAAMLATGRTP